MADIKWIKLTTGMFEDEKIYYIDSMPGADSILIIWIKLLTLAGKCNANGFIFLTENIPYTLEMLSHQFRRSLKTVRMALGILQQLNMIEMDKNSLRITNWEKHQNIEGMDKIKEQNRIRKQLQRERQKTDAQLRIRNMDNAPSIWEGASGAVHIVDPSAYTIPYVEGNNITIENAGAVKVIHAEMNLLPGAGIQISDPSENGSVEISAVDTDAGSLLGKMLDIPTFAGKDGFVLAYSALTGKFYLKEITGGGETMTQYLQPITLIMSAQAMPIPFGSATVI